jgi:hypothetical protein
MSLQEILAEIPRLSFADRQALIQHAMAVDDVPLSPEENALLDARMEDFRQHPATGVPLHELRVEVQKRMRG